ncbi:hypothetical protein ACOSZE_07010 [Lysinibacillus fusiformis]
MVNNRIALIDALRGLSLLGIFLINAAVLGYSVHEAEQDVIGIF